MSDETDSNGASLPLAALERIESVCLQFEAAWKEGHKPRIEDYLGAAQGPERRELLRQLLLLDEDYRRQQADQPVLEEYQARFPDDGELVADVFGEFSIRTASSPPPGTKVRYFGDYELLEELGHGGMGVVYKAKQASLNRIVAVKMILPARLIGEVPVRRFRVEAEAAANLQHPNIVAVHEVGVHEGQHYFSMDYVEGQSLAEMVREHTLPAKQAAEYVQRIAEAVHYAHQQGTLHRDLKPSNVLIDAHDRPRVTDFGLAKRLENDSGLTASKEILGTPSYMAPEQAEGNHEQIGVASDVYSLGAVLYDLLTGRPVFRAATPVETLRLVIDTEPVSPRLLNPKVPRDLETICLKCLEKEPHRRYGSAEALADDSRRWLKGEPIKARPISLAARTWRWCRRKPALAATGALALAAITAALVLLTVAFLIEARARDEAARHAARLLFEQSYLRCSNVEEGQGILWLARSLQEAVKVGDPELEYRVRLQLTGWSRDLHTLESLTEQEGFVYSLAMSPDGKTLAEATWKQEEERVEVQAWDVATGKAVGPPIRHEDYTHVTFLPDGKTVLTATLTGPGADGVLHLWDMRSGKAVGSTFHVPQLWVGAGNRMFPGPLPWTAPKIALSPNGKTVLIGSGDTLQIREVGTWRTVGTPFKLGDGVGPIALSPDGKNLLMAGRDTVQVHEVGSWKAVSPLLQAPGGVHTVAFSPTGRTMLAATEFDVRFWKLRSFERPALAFRPDDRQFVLFSPDGNSVLSGDPCRLSSGDFLSQLRFWQLSIGDPLGPPMLHKGMVWAAVFSPDGKTIFTRTDDDYFETDRPMGAFAEWKVAPGRMATRRIVGGWICTPDLKTVLVSERTLRLYNVETGEPAGSPMTHPGRVHEVAFSPDGKFLLTLCYHGVEASEWQDLRLWNLDTAEPFGPPVPIKHSFRLMALSPDGRTVLAQVSQRVQLFNVKTGKPVGPPLQHSGRVLTAAFSPDGKTLLTGSGSWKMTDPNAQNKARLWDVETGTLLGRPWQHDGPVRALAFSRDGKTAVTGCGTNDLGGEARIWDVETGNSVGQAMHHWGPVVAVDLSPDGKTVLARAHVGGPMRGPGYYQIRLWEVNSGRTVGPPLQLDGGTAVAFSADGKTARAACRDMTVIRWKVTPMEGDPERITLWAQVATGTELDEKGEVRVLDPQTWSSRRKRLEELGGPP